MMLLNQVTASLLTPHELDHDRLTHLLGQLMSHRVDFGDFYFSYNFV